MSFDSFPRELSKFYQTYSQIEGPFGWKPCRAFAVLARANSVITVRFVGLLMFRVHNSGLFLPNGPAEIGIRMDTIQIDY